MSARFFCLVLLVLVTGCTSMGKHARKASLDGAGVLAADLNALHPSVSPQDAGKVAAEAIATALALRQNYRVAGAPLVHNVMVNTGLREQGLCYHWADDLISRLFAVDVISLEFTRVVTRQGTSREHHAVIVTARGQAIADGVVLDAWRGGGDLIWVNSNQDRYAWRAFQP